MNENKNKNQLPQNEDGTTQGSSASSKGTRKRKPATSKKSSNTKGFRQVRMSDETDKCPKESFNDVSWYAQSPRLLQDVASLSFSEVQGLPYDLGVPQFRYNTNYNSRSIPGILMIDVSLIPGTSTSQYSAVTTAAYQVYTTVRKANSGRTNYEATDLMMYLLAVDNALAFHSFIRRVYDIAKTYSSTNRYTPRALLEAMYIDFDNVIENLSTLRYLLNEYASKLNSLPAPGYMPIFARHKWMFQNIYKDSESSKSQMYCFSPEGFFIYSPTTSEQGSSLVFKDWKPTAARYQVTGEGDSIRSWFEMLLNPLFGDTDASIMGGDIRKAFDEKLLISVDSVEVDEAIVPVYNYEVIGQINNLTTVGNYAKNNSITQVQTDPTSGNPFIKFNPLTGIENGLIIPDDYKLFLNSYHSQPRPEDVMVSTRLTSFVSYDPVDKLYQISTCGTELVHRMRIVTLEYSNRGASIYTKDISTHHIVLASGTNPGHPLISIQDVTQWMDLGMFDRHPLVYLYIGTLEGESFNNSKAQLLTLVGDLDNYTTLTRAELNKINNVAIQSEFGVYSV